MARTAVINSNNVVENVIEIEGDFLIEGKILVSSLIADIGDTFSNGEFIKPPPDPEPIPSSITPRQARLALLNAGLLDQVETALANGSRNDKITWEFATEIRRDYPLIENMASALNLTSGQVDDLFRAAANIT